MLGLSNPNLDLDIHCFHCLFLAKSLFISLSLRLRSCFGEGAPPRLGRSEKTRLAELGSSDLSSVAAWGGIQNPYESLNVQRFRTSRFLQIACSAGPKGSTFNSSCGLCLQQFNTGSASLCRKSALSHIVTILVAACSWSIMETQTDL